MDHSSMGGNSTDTCVVSMLWNWNTIDACFLSSDWRIQNNGMFAASCVGVALIAILLEALRRVSREYDNHVQSSLRRIILPSEPTSQSCPAEIKPSGTMPFMRRKARATLPQQFIRVVVHVLTFGTAYILMLLAMYYNGYIIISILAGTGIGKLLCDWMTAGGVMGQEGELDPTVCCG